MTAPQVLCRCLYGISCGPTEEWPLGRVAPRSTGADVPAACADERPPGNPSFRVSRRAFSAYLADDWGWLHDPMSIREEAAPRVVRASRDIAAGASEIFELIAKPTQQPRWDANDNLSEARPGERVRAVGDMFRMTTTKGNVRENHVVEFTEGRCIAWRPAEPGQRPPGHVWRWELEPIDEATTRVTHTYDWTQLSDDDRRIPRARATTSDKLQASIDRLASIAEGR